jgi:hypothetical protein
MNEVWTCCLHPHGEHELYPVGRRDVSIRCKHCECSSIVPIERIARDTSLWTDDEVRHALADARADERERIALNLETGAAVALGLDETAAAFLRAAAEHVRKFP